MTDKDQRAAAKQFIADWKARGNEEQEANRWMKES